MNKMEKPAIPHTTPRYSATFSNDVNSDIRRAAATGIYDIRGGGAKENSRHLTIYYFLEPLSPDTHWKDIAKMRDECNDRNTLC